MHRPRSKFLGKDKATISFSFVHQLSTNISDISAVGVPPPVDDNDQIWQCFPFLYAF